jgi:hypothetical protein
MTTPEWLAARNGRVVKGLNDLTLVVTLDGDPLYRLEALPAKGQFTCAVIQLNNGRRLDAGKVYPTAEAALAGGLDELRATLGW